MSYLKINGFDFSTYVNELTVDKTHNYSAQTNAAGDTVIDYINAKREIEVGIIPLDADAMQAVLNVIDAFNVTVSFLNPLTGELETANCIIPDSGVEYYTIQANKTSFKGFSFTCIEL